MFNQKFFTMKKLYTLFFFLVYVTCSIAQNHEEIGTPSTSSSSESNQLTIAINAQSYTLSGSGHRIVNGVYTLNGTNQLNQPRYTHSSGQYDLNYDGNGTWWLNTDKNLSGGTQFYRASGDAQMPPLTGWVDDKGQKTVLTLVPDPKNAAIEAAKNAPKPILKS